jgi:hypothetical protein
MTTDGRRVRAAGRKKATSIRDIPKPRLEASKLTVTEVSPGLAKYLDGVLTNVRPRQRSQDTSRPLQLMTADFGRGTH